MWPLGHAAVAYLSYTGISRNRNKAPPESLAVVVLVLGSQLPDLVDKPLSWYLGILPTGRSLGHSLFVIVPLVGLAYALSRRSGHETYAIAFGVGVGSHLLADGLPVVWGDADIALMLWPILGLEAYPSGAPTIAGLLADSLGEPYFLAEFLLAGLAAGLWQRDGYPGLGVLRRRLAALR